MWRIIRAVSLWAAAVALFMSLAVFAQQPQTPSAPGPRVRAAAEEVLLDVVVRDKKGHEVNDLKAEDFQIFDNGEPKEITSFRLIEGKEAIGAGGARKPLDPLQQVRLVTIIFQCQRSDARQLAQDTAPGADHGSLVTAPGAARSNLLTGSETEARRLARDAAMDLLKQGLPPSVYMSVMAIDHKLEALQPYTNDLGLLGAAIERATRSQVMDFSADTERVRKELEQAAGSNPGGQPAEASTKPANAPPATPTGSADPDAPAKAAMAKMLLQALNTEQDNAMAESGRAEIFGLLDAVKEQYRLPGRKTALFFSEGFTIPISVEGAFNDLISTANRSNVSLYVVDTHGLRTVGTNRAATDLLHSAAQSSQDQRANMGDRPVTSDEANLYDTTIQSTRANYQNTLANLADSTGGFLIANTNDMQGPIRRLAEDIQTYYEISYAPEIRNYDGSFHKIALKLPSSNLRVQSRSGYSAIPPSLSSVGTAVSAYEVPLLAALNLPELPKAFDYESAALHFRGVRNQPVCDVVMDVPLANVTFEKSNTASQVKGRLSYVVLLKDAQGQAVKKFQNDLPLFEPVERLEAIMANHFIYSVHFDLPPGSYALETAVQDGEGKRISARKTSVTVPPSSGLALSSVSVIRSTKEREASTEDSDPLLLGTKVISPTLNPVINKASTSTLPFYLVIYTDKSVAAAPQLVMEFSRNGKVLGKGLPQLGSPDKDGRIQYVAMTPLGQFEPGDFTVRFIVTQGSETAEETASFVLK